MTEKEYFKPNRILMTIIYVMTIGLLLFIFFGPPHYWDSVAPSVEKKSNEYVDSYLDKIHDSDRIECNVSLAIFDRFNGGGYFSRDKALFVDNKIICDICRSEKKASFDVETKSGEKPAYDPDAGYQEYSEDEMTVVSKHIDLYIEDGTLYISKTSADVSETLTVDDKDVIAGFEKLLFDDDVDFMKTPSEDCYKQKPGSGSNVTSYTVRRTVDLSQRFGAVCDALGAPVEDGHVSMSMYVYLVDKELRGLTIRFNDDERQNYMIDLLEYLVGDMPLDIQIYDLIASIEIK